MCISLHPQQPTSECLAETTVVPVVPSDPVEFSRMFSVVHKRLLHPQTVVQVYADTLFLNSLTREQLAEERVTPLAYVRRRLAVFELGLLALLHCSTLVSEEHRYVFENLDHERTTWSAREWSLLRESVENTHYTLGFLQSEDGKQTMPRG
jgi:hypothetical protein